MAPLIQRPAPAFKAGVVQEGGVISEVALSELAGKWVVLLFYPMDFTFVCPTEILAFNDALPQFAALNAVVYGVSTDSTYTHRAWSMTPRATGGLGPDLKLPLIADRNMQISRDYGVLLEDEGIALRGLFLIDPQGNLRQMTVNDLPVGRSVDETLRLIEAFQFAAEHGEVCPANWRKGSKTIKPDPVKSLEYFGSASTNGHATNGHTNGNVNGKGGKRTAADMQVDGAGVDGGEAKKFKV